MRSRVGKGLQCSLIPEYIVYKSSKNAKTSNRVFYFHKKSKHHFTKLLLGCYPLLVLDWWARAPSRHSRLLPALDSQQGHSTHKNSCATKKIAEPSTLVFIVYLLRKKSRHYQIALPLLSSVCISLGAFVYLGCVSCTASDHKLGPSPPPQKKKLKQGKYSESSPENFKVSFKVCMIVGSSKDKLEDDMDVSLTFCLCPHGAMIFPGPL